MSIRSALIVAAGGGLLVAALGTGVWLYGKSQYSAGRKDMRAEYQTTELIEWRRQAEHLSGISGQLESDLQALRDTKPKIIERYTREVVHTPLPADCVLDAGRLRHVNGGIESANATGQSGAALPAGTDAGN